MSIMDMGWYSIPYQTNSQPRMISISRLCAVITFWHRSRTEGVVAFSKQSCAMSSAIA